MFIFHNETTNIWSHLLYFFFVVWYGYREVQSVQEPEHKNVLILGTFGIAYIALASAMYHTFRDHNLLCFKTFVRLDYSGQVIMLYTIAASALWLGMKRYEDIRIRVLILLNIAYTSNFIMAWVTCCSNRCNHHT